MGEGEIDRWIDREREWVDNQQGARWSAIRRQRVVIRASTDYRIDFCRVQVCKCCVRTGDCWSRKELRVKMWANNFFFFFFKSDNSRFLKKILMENRGMENKGCFLILFAWTFNSFSFPSYVACCIDWNDLSSNFLRILFPCNNFFQKYLNES